MQFPSKSYLEQLRKKYPVGTKLQLISMRNEKYPVLPGTVGEVTHIDDAGSIHMRWENGSSLSRPYPRRKNKAAPPSLYSMLPYNRKDCKGVFYTIFFLHFLYI